MRDERTRFAGMLALGATVLLISILIGTRLGDHVIVAADGKSNSAAVDLPTPVPVSSATVPPSSSKWKKSHVVAVATDPAFPDPRLTPTPEPTPSPVPKATATSPQAAHSPTHPAQPNLPGFPPAGASTFSPDTGAPKPTQVPKHDGPRTSDELGE